MSGRQKLYTSAIKILRRKQELNPNPPKSRVSSHHSPSIQKSRVSSHQSQIITKSRVSGFSKSLDYLFPFSKFLQSLYSTESVHESDFICWNCNEGSPAARPFLHCWSCKAVQPVDFSFDYFQIFGVEQGFDLKDENLELKYKEWQKKLHPDLVHSKSEKEKSYAAEQSARVIDAYHTLSKPLPRALYLLQLAGIIVDEEKTVMDPDLLSEDSCVVVALGKMMELREAVEEAHDPKELMAIQSQIKEKIGDWSNSFREAFNKRDFDSAINATQKMRYYERAIEEIVKKI